MLELSGRHFRAKKENAWTRNYEHTWMGKKKCQQRIGNIKKKQMKILN